MTALQTTLGTPWLNITIFAVFVLITLVIVIRVSRGGRKGKDFYTGGGSFSGRQNGIAIAGDYLSAASFLGIAGAVAFYGYDGLLYSIGFLVAWLVALLLVAEPLRNTGKYTMADVLSFRMQNKPVRTAAAISTLAVSFFYLLAQMAGAGTLVALLLGISADFAQMGVIAIVGLLMIAYVLIGGMKGTTWVQMIKAVLLIIGAGILFFWVLGRFGFNLSDLMGAAAAKGNSEVAGSGDKLLHAMSKYGTNKLGFISLSIALVLGTAGLPHVLLRFYTVPTAKEARRSVSWAMSLNIAFLVSLAFAVAASANLPSILFSLYWKRFNTRGSVWSIYGGLVSALVLIFFSPTVVAPVGTTTPLATAMLPNVHWGWFPLDNPAIVSVPITDRVPAGHPRHTHEQGVQPRQAGRDGGPLTHRSRRREGVDPLAI